MSKHKYSLEELRELKDEYYNEVYTRQRGFLAKDNLDWYSVSNFLIWLEEREKEE